jgi:ABC-2 type transport system ATP-binding protein
VAVIEAVGLGKRYGSKPAVVDLSFRVNPGSVTGFLGPNGAGKATTMRLMLGLDNGDGRTTFDGVPFRQLDRPVQHVGALLEASAFHPTRKARNHLRMLAAANSIPDSRVDEVMGLVGLTSVAGDKPRKFSLGMAQRLGIAAARLGNPHTLIITSGPIRDFITSSQRTSVIVRSPDVSVMGPALAERGGYAVAAEDGSYSVTGISQTELGDLAHEVRARLHELRTLEATLEEAFLDATGMSEEFVGQPARPWQQPAAGPWAAPLDTVLSDGQITSSVVSVGASIGNVPLFSAYIIAMLGVFSFGHEYRDGMIRSTLTAVPSRGAVLTAKIVTTALLAAVLAVACALIGLLNASLFLGGDVAVFIAVVVARTGALFIQRDA